MFCYYCGATLDSTDKCPKCGADVRIIKKIQAVSNRLYNDALVKVNVRDMSGAVQNLKLSLRYNKMNMNARNLLGLIYFEIGESVNAVGEWVISKSLIPEHNPASEYLSMIQNNNTHMETLNQTIKKFNQALLYCQQGNDDLAVIQLKKVLSMNPKLVKGHHLLALLYMKQGRYDLAQKALQQAGKVDANNRTTKMYMHECEEHLKAGSEQDKADVQSDSRETVSHEKRGGERIMQSRFLRDTSVRMSVINLLVGALIGVAIVCFLIIPSVRQNARNDANSAVVQANEQLSTKDQSIQSLQAEIDSLNKQIEESKQSSASADKVTDAYDALLNAYIAYKDGDYEEAGKDLQNVDSKLFSSSATEVYTQVFDEVKDTVLGDQYTEAVGNYTDGNYEEAITQFLDILNTDEGYKNGRAAYYLAHCYYKQKDGVNAQKWFQAVVDNDSASKSIKKEARSCLSFMDSNKEEYGLDGTSSGTDGTDTSSGTDGTDTSSGTDTAQTDTDGENNTADTQ